MNKLWSATIWRLVRAEMSYNLFMHAILFITLTFSFYLFGGLAARGVRDPSLPHLLAVAIMYFLYTTPFAEKRTRFMQIMPISQRDSALARLYSQALYWIGALVIYTVSLLAYFPQDMLGDVLWRLLALNAFLLTANAAFCLSFDLWAVPFASPFFKPFLVSLMWMLVLTMGSLSYEGYSTYLLPGADRLFLSFLYKSPLGILLQHLTAVGLSILSYKFHMRRQTLT